MRARAFLFGLAILLSPYLGVASEQRTAVMPQYSPGETAETILLQANKYNVEAIIRVVIGYSYGIDGFHKDTSLAKAWLKPLLALEAMDAYAISALCVDLNEDKLQVNIGRSLVHCTMATPSAMATELENSNIFNVEKLCSELVTQNAINNNWKDEYDEAYNTYKTITREISKVHCCPAKHLSLTS